MNVQLDNLPNCITTMRVEVPADKVSSLRETITRDYAKHAKLPGYRPGKAPRAVVEAKYKKEIREELEKQILSDSCRSAIAENKLRVLSISDVQDTELTAEGTFRFTATLVTAPAFALPEYKSLAIELPSADVTEEAINEGIDRLREQFADFKDLEGRTLTMDDFAVVSYVGTVDGKPLAEAIPAAHAMLGEKNDFWIKLTPEAFLPGFAAELVGASIGDVREFDLTVPADFPAKEIAGVTLHYKVTVNSIKDKVLPEVDDEFVSKVAPGKTVAEFREMLQADLVRQKQFEREQAKREEIMKKILASVECELPENMVQAESNRILGQIIQENQNRGVSEEVIRENVQSLIASAGESARERLKGTFVLNRIAEEEKISVTREEFKQRVEMMASRYGMTLEKMWKRLEKAEALERVNEEILTGKVLDFLASTASVSDSAPSAS